MAKRSKPRSTSKDQQKRKTAATRSAAAPGAGKGGTVPPAEHRFKPGQSGNPAGRPKNAGATCNEWLNQLAADELTEDQLRQIASNAKLPWPKRAAALRALRALEHADVTDFINLIHSSDSEELTASLSDLRDRGVHTDAIKKLKPTEHGIEIELHDRSGEEFDRICDRTNGKPKMEITQHVDGSIRSAAEGADTAAALLDQIRRRIGVDGK